MQETTPNNSKEEGEWRESAIWGSGEIQWPARAAKEAVWTRPWPRGSVESNVDSS
jgi:hypothetical protein